MTPSEAVRQSRYRLLFLPSALTEWLALDGSVKEPWRELLQKRLHNPHVPGEALQGELRDYYKIKLDQQGIRLVYGVEADARIVMVMAVARREDGVVYRSVMARLSEKAASVAQAIQSQPEQ